MGVGRHALFKTPQLLKWLARDSNSDPCSRAGEHGEGAAGSRERAECSEEWNVWDSRLVSGEGGREQVPQEAVICR